MKKIISLILCLCMILSAVSLLAGCRKKYTFSPVDGEIAVSEEIVDFDLTDYVMSYDKSMSATTRQEAANLVAELRTLSQVAISIREDMEKSVVDNENPEILIGNTKRAQTAEALKYVKNHGWAICVIGPKLVITGTTAMMTRYAVQYFAENYLKSENVSGAVLKIPSAIVYSDMEVTTLFDDRSVSYKVVYDDQYDDINETAELRAETGDNSKRFDYSQAADPQGGSETDEIYEFSVGFTATFSETSGLTQATLKLSTDDKTATDHEVLVGNMDRADVKAQLADLAANEYGVAIDGKKIYLLAWNVVALKYTPELFKEVLADCTLTDDLGNKTYVVPKSASFKKAINKNTWKVDFPKPEGENIVLDGTLDVANNSIEYIYSGSGINANAFHAYCQKLTGAGYTLLEGSANQIGNDLFRNYVNDKTKTSLYVYLSNYQYASQYNITDVLPSIRIIASPTDGELALPTAEMMDPTKYNNRSYTAIPGKESMISQLKLEYGSGSFGNAYFYTLADGSFVVYDGGCGKAKDCENMWKALNAAYKEMHGTEPTSDKPIHIRAWWLSHEHQDHFTVFKQFVESYGKNSKLRFDALLFNSVSASVRVNTYNGSETVIQSNMRSLQSKVTDGFDLIKMHTGQVFYFVNLKLEVLYTYEDAYPKGLEYFNNSSTVIRGTLKTSSGNESTCVWLGDLERIGGRRLMAAYGPNMKADHVQVAHHGHTGVPYELYELISPEIVWWPTRIKDYRKYISNANHKTWYYRVDYKIAYQLASVKLIIIADTYNTTMEVTGTEADWTNLHDLGGTNPVQYTTVILASTEAGQMTIIQRNRS